MIAPAQRGVALASAPTVWDNKAVDNERLQRLYEMSPPLTGEDAERFVAYIENPQLSREHDEFLDEARRVFRTLVKQESANSLFPKK